MLPVFLSTARWDKCKGGSAGPGYWATSTPHEARPHGPAASSSRNQQKAARTPAVPRREPSSANMGTGADALRCYGGAPTPRFFSSLCTIKIGVREGRTFTLFISFMSIEIA